jgi:hypothetical protein
LKVLEEQLTRTTSAKRLLDTAQSHAREARGDSSAPLDTRHVIAGILWLDKFHDDDLANANLDRDLWRLTFARFAAQAWPDEERYWVNLPGAGAPVATSEDSRSASAPARPPDATGANAYDLVREAQLLLQPRVRSLQTDGELGRETRAAVSDFQKEFSLDPNGSVTPELVALLREHLGPRKDEWLTDVRAAPGPFVAARFDEGSDVWALCSEKTLYRFTSEPLRLEGPPIPITGHNLTLGLDVRAHDILMRFGDGLVWVPRGVIQAMQSRDGGATARLDGGAL